MRDVTRSIDGSYYATKRRSKGWILRKLLSLLDHSLRSIAISLIGGYQYHLSPRKGYSCAHRVVHGGDSCSEYVKNALADKSLFEATLLARRRFKACSIAYVSSKDQVVKFKIPTIGPNGCADPEMIGACCAILGIAKMCSGKRS
ncbi:membrane protein insertion efficiency factor YidD [Phormidesmis priestleyi ULC007]|uniref:Membrane protein insertion efficiency factor YidD n=1 Tax=Phormidesmis priestleyi ULC007 TaxID=1920490 RepID=A0A2T1D7F8_9CYAN|nr:membrane protein insertion efficiency factor YidD [Phormidesmis priestleyi ULC007]PZO47357.1 MAG: membrane protein insertion efficiency factor YidD [Phormidesmis priestleyi]